MKQFPAFFLLLVLALTLAACAGDAEAPAPQATNTIAPTGVPTGTPPPTVTATPAATPTAALTATPAPTDTPPPTATAPPPTASATAPPDPGSPVEIEEEETIRILSPGNASRVTSPVNVVGEADSTFEQSLVVRIVTVDGQELLLQPATIAADLGQRGPFETQVPFQVQQEVQAWIQVYATSARDGGITHLSSVAVTLAPGGAEDIVEPTPQPERIVIDSPATGDTISGGVLQLTGRGLASFEQTLIAELLDEAGNVMVVEPLIVNAPDLGQPGSFEAQLTYDVSESTPARLQVYDPSPAFGGYVHLSSVELFLEP